MKLSREQLKQARQFCKDNNIDVRFLCNDFTPAYWEENCGGTFEGYLADIMRAAHSNNPVTQAILDRSLQNYRNGRSGLESLTK